MSCLVRVPGVCLLIYILFLLCTSQAAAFQPEGGGGQARGQAAKDDGVMEVFDKGKVIDKVDIPGRVLASKQIIKLTEDLVSKTKLRHREKGPDYSMDIDVEPRIKIEGIIIGIKGQSRKTDVMFEGKSRTVLLQTNSGKGASLEVLVFLNGIPVEQDTNTLDDTESNRFIAKNAIALAFKKWELEKATMTIGYVHYVYTEPAEDFGDEKSEN